MVTCDRCGAFVSKDFFRVFGTNDGILDGCPDCTEGGVVSGETADHDSQQARRAHIRTSA
jgi:hypothetical protein